MFAVSCVTTQKFANPIIPTLLGVMMGLTIPKPSDEWVRKVVGESWFKPIELAMGMIGVAVGIIIFNAIAKRHHA